MDLAFEQTEFERSFQHFSSTRRLNSFVKQNMSFVEPEEYVFGRKTYGKLKSMCYVSILQTLHALIERDDVFAEVVQGHRQDGFLSDYCDGSHCDNNPLFSQHYPALQIQLYNDDFTVANPIGNKVKQLKFSAFYFCLGNISPKLRSKLYSIQLAMLCPTEILKEVGMSAVVAPLIADLKILERDGINIDKDGTVHNFKGSLSMVVAVNLAAHCIGGYQESFNTRRLCRFCSVKKETLKSHFRDTTLQERTEDSYNQQADLAEQLPEMARIYGIKKASPLNQLQYYHDVNGQPPDIAHDLFEGIVPNVLELVILYCVREGFFNLDFLNDQVENFPYKGTDKTNKPSKMSNQPGKFKVKQKAVALP